jgi:hypothetical protein
MERYSRGERNRQQQRRKPPSASGMGNEARRGGQQWEGQGRDGPATRLLTAGLGGGRQVDEGAEPGGGAGCTLAVARATVARATAVLLGTTAEARHIGGRCLQAGTLWQFAWGGACQQPRGWEQCSSKGQVMAQTLARRTARGLGLTGVSRRISGVRRRVVRSSGGGTAAWGCCALCEPSQEWAAA